MIYVETLSTDPLHSFGAEYYFATERDLGDTVLLLWSTEPSLIVGKYQNILEEIDRHYAESHGIRIVRRLSGGGTMYIDRGGLEFSYLVRDGAESIDFSAFVGPVVDALNRLGVPALANGRNDITVDGKKISGNSQYKLNGVTVHHGTLMFDVDIDEMVRATTPKDYKITSKAIKSVRDRVTNIKPYLPPDMDINGFREALRALLVPDGHIYIPTAAEEEKILTLGKEHFTAAWEAQPKFEMTKTLHLPGGSMEFSLTVRKNKIAAAAVTGDFFATVTPEEIAACLVGAEMTACGLTDALMPLSGKIHRITPQEMAEGLLT